MTKTDNKTVATVRTEMEATEEIPQLKETIGKDGRARATKRKKRSTTVENAAAAPVTPPTAVPPSTTTGAPAPTTTTAATATPTAPLAVNRDMRAAPPPPASQALGTKDLENQIAEDRKYARALVEENRKEALWLRAILGNERRRSAVADALAGALKNTENATPSSATGRNDAQAAESAEARKVVFTAADREVAQ